MRLLKHFFSGCLLGCLGVAPLGAISAEQSLSSCLELGKNQFRNSLYAQAQATFQRCLQLDSENVEAHLSLAGVLLSQEKLPQAQTHFEEALSHMKRTSPYWSYTYSMLGDIAFKQQQQSKALSLYSKSIEYNAANVNSLIGRGIILESQGNYLSAAESYESALAVEPLNVIARQRLINLEPEYLPDEEILTALKQRHAIRPEVMELTDKNRVLFANIHRAEKRRGIDYLKNKYGRNTHDYIVTLNQGTDFAREILTLNGFNTLEKDMGQDAVSVFRKLKIPVQDIFALRDKEGKPVFTDKTTLTEEGFYVYTQALAGKKEYLLPQQSVPLTQKEIEKANARAKVLEQRGYMEISRPELKLLETKTYCSEETLKNKLGVYFLPVAKKQYRYFVRTADTQPLKTVPYYYIMQSRHKRNPKLEVPKNETVEYYNYYGYTVCLSDGNLTLNEEK